MKNYLTIKRIVVAWLFLLSCIVSLLMGCAPSTNWGESPSPNFVNGTRILAEVIYIAKREDIVGKNEFQPGWWNTLQAAGYSEADIIDGSEMTVFSYCYGFNSGVPTCQHNGMYLAHASAELSHGLRGNYGNANSQTGGDLLEIELTKIPTGKVIGKVVAVFRKSDQWGSCRIAQLVSSSFVDVMQTLALVGPPRAMWIECDDLESEGWTRKPVGGPPSEGPSISQWIKLPK